MNSTIEDQEHNLHLVHPGSSPSSSLQATGSSGRHEILPVTRAKEHDMTSDAQAGSRILGSLGSADGKCVVRMTDRINAVIDDVWSALADPSHLAHWYGEVTGDLRLGGDY